MTEQTVTTVTDPSPHQSHALPRLPAGSVVGASDPFADDGVPVPQKPPIDYAAWKRFNFAMSLWLDDRSQRVRVYARFDGRDASTAEVLEVSTNEGDFDLGELNPRQQRTVDELYARCGEEAAEVLLAEQGAFAPRTALVAQMDARPKLIAEESEQVEWDRVNTCDRFE